MIQKTTWHPDTCGCVIEFEWDNSLPQDKRIHTASKVVKACPAHEHHVNKDDHYADLTGENVSKNKAVTAVAQAVGVDAHEVAWAFDKDRKLVVSHKDLTQEHKDELAKIDKAEFTQDVRFE